MAKKSKPAPRKKVPKLGARSVLLERAKTASSETRQLDFKGEFHDNKQGWCGVIKDMMAMANSGGGIIVFGCESDGTPSGKDCSFITATDVAVFIDKISTYTGYQFGDIEVATVTRGGLACPALIVGESDIPIPFAKPGEYEVIIKDKPTKRTEFAAGTMYFRHGAKSDPAMRADLAAWITRHSARERKAMMQNVKKVVSAPQGHIVSVVPPNAKLHLGEDGVKVRYSTDTDAIKVNVPAPDKTHPLKRAALIAQVRRAARKTLGLHDVTCLNRHFKVFTERREFAIKPHPTASPQYSPTYAEFLAQQLTADPSLLSTARKSCNNRGK